MSSKPTQLNELATSPRTVTLETTDNKKTVSTILRTNSLADLPVFEDVLNYDATDLLLIYEDLMDMDPKRVEDLLIPATTAVHEHLDSVVRHNHSNAVFGVTLDSDCQREAQQLATDDAEETSRRINNSEATTDAIQRFEPFVSYTVLDHEIRGYIHNESPDDFDFFIHFSPDNLDNESNNDVVRFLDSKNAGKIGVENHFRLMAGSRGNPKVQQRVLTPLTIATTLFHLDAETLPEAVLAED